MYEVEIFHFYLKRATNKDLTFNFAWIHGNL